MIRAVITAVLLANALPLLNINPNSTINYIKDATEQISSSGALNKIKVNDTIMVNTNMVAFQNEMIISTITQNLVITEEEHNPIFDEFINDKEEDGYKYIRSTFSDRFINKLINVCEETGVDPWLIVSIVETESGFDPNAKAYDGSKHYGLMQLAVKYFTEDMLAYGTDNFFDAETNVTVGTNYIKQLMDRCENFRCVKNSKHDYPLEEIVVFIFHKGEEAIPLYKEGTIDDYTEKVISNWLSYKETYGGN